MSATSESRVSPRRALVVIDVQNEYVTGDLPIEYPDIRQSLHHIGMAMDAAHAHRIPIVVIRNEAPPTSPLFAAGTHGAKLHPVVTARPFDALLRKTLPDAFTGTDLEERLRRDGIDTVTLVGYMTHNCVDATARHALHLGFEVEFLHDASGSVPYRNRMGFQTAEQLHRAFSVVLQSRFAAVAPTHEWIEALARGTRLPRDTIHRSNVQARQRETA